MSTSVNSVIGWTISQWKDFTTSESPEKVLSTLQDLVKSFSKEDPAWISIASPELIASQWSGLQKLTADPKSVCIIYLFINKIIAFFLLSNFSCFNSYRYTVSPTLSKITLTPKVLLQPLPVPLSNTLLNTMPL